MGMRAIRERAQVQGPRLMVYRYLENLSNYPSFLKDAFALFEVTSPSPSGVGASATYLVKLGQRQPGELRIARAAEPARVEVAGRHAGTDFTLTFDLQEVVAHARPGPVESTQVTLEYSYRVAGLLGPLADRFSVRPTWTKACRRALARLKANLQAFQH